MDDQGKITEEQFLINETINELGQVNAQQAVTISNLRAQLKLIQAKAQQAQPQMEEPPIAGSEPIVDEEVIDVEDDLPVIN